MFKGIRSIIYPSSDLAADKAFWTQTLGAGPYFDEPYYVGFSVGGYELGLDPNGPTEGQMGPVTYFGVDDIDAEVVRLGGLGVKQRSEIQDVGAGIRLATFLDANGIAFGIIENPNFKADSD